ncbi:MAG: winged helix-turn-helix transcriptional regulator [Clostridia bacterium]|nr:winged helix-turn-helix transcriptional regulator [Clostridia bacterium]
MRICILSDDPLLGRLLELECQALPVTVCRGGSSEIPAADLYLCDLDSVTPPEGDVITFGQDGDYPRDYSAGALYTALCARITHSADLPMRLFPTRRSVLLDGREIALSRREFALLSALLEADGAYLSRAELIGLVWDGAADEKTVNVYIHYLREKLEKDGRRRIQSDRTRGYALLKGGVVC